MRLETNGQQLKEVEQTLLCERSSAHEELAQAKQACGSAQAEALDADEQRAQISQDLAKSAACISSLEAQVKEAHAALHDTTSKGGEVEKRVQLLMSEVAARDTRLLEMQAKLEETRVDLRAAEERAALVESELPASLDRCESLDKEKVRIVRQLELVGERVMELEAANDAHTRRAKLQDEMEALRDEAARETARILADREEERMLLAADKEVECSSLVSDLQRERTCIQADFEAERAVWAIERDRLTQDGLEALEAERSLDRHRSAAIEQEREIERQDAAAKALGLSEQIAAAQQASTRLNDELVVAQLKSSALEDQSEKHRANVRHLEQQVEQTAQQFGAERRQMLQMQQRLSEVEAARKEVVCKLQEHHAHLDAAAVRQAASEVDVLVARDLLGTKENEMKANMCVLEDKMRRGAEERRALERLHGDLKTQLSRRQAATERLLYEQKHTRSVLASTGVGAVSLASSSASLDSQLADDDDLRVSSCHDEQDGEQQEMCPREHEIRCRGHTLDLHRKLEHLQVQLDAALKVFS